MLIRRIAAIAFAAVTLAVGLPPGAAAEDATTTTTWSIAPATAEGPDGRVSLRHVLDPGSVVDDMVAVTNFSATAASFDVYANDGIVTESGDFDLLAPGATPTDGGSWVSVGEVGDPEASPSGGRRLSVPAGGTVMLPLRITVPMDAEPGDHPAGVVAELVRESGDAVQLATRTGVRMHLRVAGEIVPALAIDDIRSVYTPSWNPFAPGTLSIDFTVRNTGNIRVGTDVVTSATGFFGLLATSATDSRREVLPGQTADHHIDLSWWPSIVVQGDLTATPAVVGDDEPAGGLSAATRTFSGWAPPWSQLASLLVLVGATVLIRAARRRSAMRLRGRIDAAVAAAQASADTSSAHGEPRPEPSVVGRDRDRPAR